MQDSRLIQMRAMARECQTLAADLLAEGVTSPHDMLSVAQAEKWFAAAEQAVNAAYSEPVCGASGGFQSVCELPAGHDGKHRQGTFLWVKPMTTDAMGRLD